MAVELVPAAQQLAAHVQPHSHPHPHLTPPGCLPACLQGLYDDVVVEVDTFCRKFVEPMGEESDHIHIVALCDALQVRGDDGGGACDGCGV